MMEHVELLEMKVDDQQTEIDELNSHRTGQNSCIKQQREEINELKAMVNALHSALAGAQEHQWCGLRHNGRDNKHPLWVAGVNALNNTPTQCLASVKADAVDEFAMHIGLTGKALSNYVNNLRKTMITTSSESSLSEVINKINEEL